MKPRQLVWKWLLLGLVVTLLIASFVIPRVIPDSTQVANRVAAELSAWTGGKVAFSGPVRVRYFPDVSVRGRFELEGGTRLPLVRSIVAKEAKVSLSLIDLLRGRVSIDAFRLVKPRILLTRSRKKDAPVAEPRAVIDALLAKGSVRVVHVRDGTLIFRTANGREAIKDIDAHFDASDGEGSVASFGSFVLRSETVRFALDNGALTKHEDASALPVNLTLTSGPIDATVTGSASFGSTVMFDGNTQINIDNLRRFFAWSGIELPNGESLRGFTAAGAFRLAGPTLTFDDGSFALDGNNAVGLLAITAGARPRIEGTLAFERLTLDPYIASDSAAGTNGSPTVSFDQALLRNFDADLRLSAGTIEAGNLKLGRGAFTITAKADALTSEVSELELCGGSASGRFGVDVSQAAKHLTLMADLADVTIDSCLAQLGLGFPLKGVSAIKTELASEGRDTAELLRGLSGSLKVKAKSGAVPVDLGRLMAASVPLDGDSWSPGSVTSFDLLNADCRLAAGHIWCQNFSMQTPQGVVSGSGDVDLPRQTLDWNLSVKSQSAPAKSIKVTAADPPKVSIRGSLAQPSIRRADHQALGDGAVGTGSLAPAVAPR